MDISTGFQIERPKIFVPWGCSPSELQRLFTGHSLERIVPNKFTTSCTSLGGLSHRLHFRFDEFLGSSITPQLSLRELYFSHHSYSESGVIASFDAFPKHLRATFGAPSTTTLDDDGYPSDNWTLPGVVISYVVFHSHGGPEELLRITKL